MITAACYEVVWRIAGKERKFDVLCGAFYDTNRSNFNKLLHNLRLVWLIRDSRVCTLINRIITMEGEGPNKRLCLEEGPNDVLATTPENKTVSALYCVYVAT